MKLADVTGNNVFGAVITQRNEATARDPARTCDLSVRRVSHPDRLESVQIEARILTHHATRTLHNSVSIALSQMQAEFIARTIAGTPTVGAECATLFRRLSDLHRNMQPDATARGYIAAVLPALIALHEDARKHPEDYA